MLSYRLVTSRLLLHIYLLQNQLLLHNRAHGFLAQDV